MWILKFSITFIIGFSLSNGTPLVLTPYIEAGQIQIARNLASVTGLTPALESYAFFLTVDRECDTNLFFWFFPSQNDWLNDPVTIWLQGGPGLSSLKGLLQEHGPYALNKNGELTLRENTINRNSSVIYVDNPAGAGFSYSTFGCYDGDEVLDSQKIRVALDQFFTLFPELAGNPFYAAGEGYAGKFATLLAFDNHISENKTFNLQGLILNSGTIDPRHQFQVVDYMYFLGIADQMDRFLLEYFAYDVEQSCDGGDIGYCSYAYQNTYLDIISDACFFDDNNNILYASGEPLPKIEPFVANTTVRQALHVDDAEFQDSSLIAERLYATVMRPARAQLEILLEHYRALFYSGQLYLQYPYSANRRMIDAFDWSGAEEHRNAERKIWYVDDDIAGYVQSGGNLTEVLVRNAGRTVLADAPKWGLELYNKFLFNQPIVPN